MESSTPLISDADNSSHHPPRNPPAPEEMNRNFDNIPVATLTSKVDKITELGGTFFPWNDDELREIFTRKTAENMFCSYCCSGIQIGRAVKHALHC